MNLRDHRSLLFFIVFTVFFYSYFTLHSFRRSTSDEGYEYTIPYSVIKRDQTTLFYNRVPKCGSTTMLDLIRKLAHINNFTVEIELPAKNKEKKRQEKIAQKARRRRTKTCLQGHFKFLNITKFNGTQPIYMNLVREPAEIPISLYFYKRADEIRKMKIESQEKEELLKSIAKKFETCYQKREVQCSYVLNEKSAFGVTSSVIPYFCGNEEYCRIQGSFEALERAKYVIDSTYVVVGVLEEFHKTLTVLEAFIPQYFRNASSIYRQKKFISNIGIERPKYEDVLRELRKNMTLEYDLYYFIKRRLHLQYQFVQENKV